jgi:MinD-like ATPase involved in chromosome partitioning or flagellar assembly
LKDDKLGSSVRMQKPVSIAYPKARITHSLAALAAKLEAPENDNITRQEGFFYKVVNWFF